MATATPTAKSNSPMPRTIELGACRRVESDNSAWKTPSPPRSALVDGSDFSGEGEFMILMGNKENGDLMERGRPGHLQNLRFPLLNRLCELYHIGHWSMSTHPNSKQ